MDTSLTFRHVNKFTIFWKEMNYKNTGESYKIVEIGGLATALADQGSDRAARHGRWPVPAKGEAPTLRR